jgi:hypothetical protein
MKIMRTEIEYSAKTFTELIENVYGYFCFWCNQNNDESQFPHFDKEPEKGVVNAITYISPEALTLFNTMNFNCIVLDGTFKLIPNFVVAIVSGIKFNTYFPLGYTISTSESSEMYDRFYKFFNKITQKDLSQLPVLSDKHAGIRAFCSGNQIPHYFCIVHLLRSFGANHHLLYAVKKLLLMNREHEAETFLSYLSISLKSEFDNQVFIKKISAVGLKIQARIVNENEQVLSEEQIVIDRHSPLFYACCAAYRIERGIPISTNSIESVHDHFNEGLPRNLTVIHGLNVAHELINHRYETLQDAINRSFKKVIDKIEQELQSTTQASMEEQCSQYSTNRSFCACGRSTRISGLYRFDIPCSHRMYKGELVPNEKSVQLTKFELPIRQHYIETSEMSLDTPCQHKKKSGPPIQENEKEKQYENLSELTVVFENMLKVIMKITKLTNRNDISRLVRYDFYQPVLYQEMERPVWDKVARCPLDTFA